jgi:hypothetical protein
MNGTNRKLPAAKTGQGHGPLYIRGQVSRFVPVRFHREASPPARPPPPPPNVRLSKSQAVDLARLPLRGRQHRPDQEWQKAPLHTPQPMHLPTPQKDCLTRIVFRVPTVFACVPKSGIGSCSVFPSLMRGTRRTRPFRAEIKDLRPRVGVNVFLCGTIAIRHHRSQIWLRVQCGLTAAKVHCKLTAVCACCTTPANRRGTLRQPATGPPVT